MVKLPQLPLPGEEALRLDHPYRIISVSQFTSELRNFPGLRVELDGGVNDHIVVTPWLRETVGRKSKIGAFILALGNDTDQWIGKVIIFRRWESRNREIEVVKE